MHYYLMQAVKVGFLFSLVWISSCLKNAQAASPIWAQPPLKGLIEEALVQNQEIKSL